MTVSKKRQDKINAIQTQITEGLHPLQHPDEKVRKKVALRVAKKMIDEVVEKVENVEAHRSDAPDA
jgi:hypothetical protein